jgi:hypothetical protein
MDRKEQLKQLLGSTNALLEAMRYSTSTATGDAANVGRWSSYGIFLRKYNHLAQLAAPLLSNLSLIDTFDLTKVRSSSNTVWPQQKENFELAYANASLLKSLLEGEIGYAADETHRLIDFIQGNLRRAVYEIPQREVEVQNAIETLIVGRGMAKGTDYDRETGRVKNSGKESIPDFIFPVLNLCLEAKLSKTLENRRAIVDELNADIRAYAKLYDRQIYVIYDLGTIRDETEFKRDLENAPGVAVLIVKH